MEINLRFFASVREALGTSQEKLLLPPSVKTVGQVRELLIERGGVWSQTLAHDRALRMAFNHVMCEPDTEIRDGAEVAFFPPVTGG
jgi:molybdopterin synthase sulfur carrier subunit